MVGAATGLVGGGAIGHLSTDKGEGLRKALTNAPGPAGSFARFGQRQVHGVTGWTPGGGVQEIRHGAWAKAQALKHSEQALANAKTSPASPGFVDKVLGRTPEQVAQRGVASATKANAAAIKAHAAAQDAERMGLTSLPGYAKAIRDKGVLGVAPVVARDAWHGGDPLTKTLLAGSALGVAREAVRKEDPAHPERSKTERVVRATGQLAGAGAMTPLPMYLQGKLMSAGMAAGSTVDRLRGKGSVMARQAPDLTADSGQAVPGERIVSERMAGSMGEGSPS